MANDASKQEPPSLDDFSERLDAARGVKAEKEIVKNASGAAWGRAMRVSTEMLVGLFVGGLLGVGLDKAFSTAPLFLLVGLVLGFAAGLRNLSRALDAGELTAGDLPAGAPPQDGDKSAGEPGAKSGSSGPEGTTLR